MRTSDAGHTSRRKAAGGPARKSLERPAHALADGSIPRSAPAAGATATIEPAVDVRPDVPMLPDLYAVQHVKSETADTFTLEIAPADGTSPRRFLAGQFNMMWVPGVGEVPISISGDPGKHDTIVHTVRAVGGVTKAMKALRPGALIGIRGPFGTGWPVAECSGRDVVIIAGGIGLAPLRPALYQVLADRERYGRVILLYGCRTPDDLLFKKEIALWRSRLDMHVYVTVDRASGHWHGYVGVVTTVLPKAPFTPENTIAVICGPEVMMRFSAMGLEERGVAATSIYLSMERNMKCGIGLCGHCQYGPTFICKDGPVFRYDRIRHLLPLREV